MAFQNWVKVANLLIVLVNELKKTKKTLKIGN